jgi:hypothetical protein
VLELWPVFRCTLSTEPSGESLTLGAGGRQEPTDSVEKVRVAAVLKH